MRVRLDDGVRLFVDIDGPALVTDLDTKTLRERPTIVAMHGGPGLDHVGLKLGLAGLGDAAQCIVYDHRGHGRSDRRSPDEWTLDTWADDLVRLCDALGIEKPIVLGNSFGGFVAQRYLMRHPGHASKVILYATMAHGRLDDVAEGFRVNGGDDAGEAARAFWSAPSVSTVAAFVSLCRPLYSRSGKAPAGDALTTRNDAVLAHFLADEMWTMDHRHSLASVECPVLVLSGAHDPVCGPGPTREMVDALPRDRTTFVQFEESAHTIATDEPEAFRRAILEFLTNP